MGPLGWKAMSNAALTVGPYLLGGTAIKPHRSIHLLDKLVTASWTVLTLITKVRFSKTQGNCLILSVIWEMVEWPQWKRNYVSACF